MNSNAYMIRNDGKIIPCTQHIYGSLDTIDETLYAAEWLYKATRHNSTKELVIKFISVWAKQLPGESNVYNNIINDIKSKPYTFLSIEFINIIEDKLNSGDGSLDKLNEAICNELNQEFLRARYGGVYNSTNMSKEMVFRISSVGFNWYNIIWSFVADHQSEIKTVTIVRDEESTGSFFYYKSKKGEYNQMPIDEFLSESGNPVVEKFGLTVDKYTNVNRKILESLDRGASIEELYRLRINKDRINTKYEILKHYENSLNKHIKNPY